MNYNTPSEFNQSFLLDREMIISPPKMETKVMKKIMHIQGMTGLRILFNYPEIFEDNINLSDVEIVVKFLDKMVDFSKYENNPFDFISKVLSNYCLIAAGATDEDYYHHLDIETALTSILTKVLEEDKYPLFNGFPDFFKFTNDKVNKTQTIEEVNYFPFGGNINIANFNQLLIKITKTFKFKFSWNNLFFHGTNFDSAILINDQIRIIQRDKPTDFGLKNFYLTDNFIAACNWTKHFSNQAIVVFYIPDEYLNNLEKRLHFDVEEFDDIARWQDLVFKCRNPPKPRNISRQERLKEFNEYNKFISDLDSNDLISGPICTNPKDVKDKLEYLKSYDSVPYQYSFKESQVNMLNDFIVTTILFKSE